LASLRGVARTVKQHAAAKLKREKKLVDDALRALRPEDAPPASDTADELSAPSSTDISVVSGSLTASKESGVFAHHTQPGSSWVGRPRASTDATTGSMSAVSVDHAAMLAARAKRAGSSSWVNAGFAWLTATRTRQVGMVVVVALCGGVAAGAYELAFAKRPVNRTELAPTTVTATAKAAEGYADGSRSASVTVSVPVSNPVREPVREPTVAPSRESGEEPAQEPALRKASRTRVERAVRTNGRAARRLRREPNPVRSGETIEQPGADDVIPNPYTR
jgi:hypothetical protein